MTIDELSKRVTTAGKFNQANKEARANAERLLESTGASTLAEALDRQTAIDSKDPAAAGRRAAKANNE